ncbi:hypothetical protein ACF0H5_019558 [Mactra antiquata]
MTRRCLAFAVWLVLLSTILPEGNARRRNWYESGELVENTDAKVLILGAGAAGLSAAKTLYDAGFKHITIIEATDRIGGRVKNTELAGYPVELGAMWVYGKGSNPVYRMTRRYGISTIYDNTDWTVRDVEGRNVTARADNLYDKVDSIIKEISQFSKTYEQDYSLAGGLRYFDYRTNTDIGVAVEGTILDFETGVPSKAHSAKYLNMIEGFEDFGNNELLICNDRRGFVSMLEIMSEEVLASADTQLNLDTVVTDIKYDSDSVRVDTSDGRVFDGDYAITTFSLGVLQKDKISFRPSLPFAKRFAIDTFGFVSFSHIFLKFDYGFWDDTTYVILATTIRGRNSFFLNMNVVYPGSNILLLSLLDVSAEWVERVGEGEVIGNIMETLRKFYPDQYVDYPVDYVFSRWNFDPFYLGAWSYWPPNFTLEDMEQLIAPVGHLYFAGEYAHELHYGFVHGAYLSGVRAAEDLMTDWLENHKSEKECYEQIVNGTLIVTATIMEMC